MNIPEELYYTKEHEWISVKDEIGTVGITDHAQKELGDVVYVELPEPGSRVAAEEPLGSVESVKAVSEIYAPVSGRVLETNALLVDVPETLNQDPYGKGWIVRIKLDDNTELHNLMSSEEYRKYLEEEVEE
ncbi:MAG TPA: glycine cleavage system protein GcvH [Acidobacteriota bacterium]|nr:glycine cleavage system protein GcvH [Acidobacteriota bacterium]